MKSDETEAPLGTSSSAKKWAMRQYWRIQQSQTIISMVFWVTTITLLIWPYVSWRFEGDSTLVGLSVTYWGLASIGASVIVLVLLIGVLYDAVFGLWREHLTIVGERNPFQTYQMSPNLMIMLLQTNLILRRLSEDDEEILRHCDFIDRWYKWNVDTEIFARAVEGWDSIVKDNDPFLPNLTDEERQKLAESVENLT